MHLEVQQKRGNPVYRPVRHLITCLTDKRYMHTIKTQADHLEKLREMRHFLC